jgi:hypothetical protein
MKDFAFYASHEARQMANLVFYIDALVRLDGIQKVAATQLEVRCKAKTAGATALPPNGS